MIDEKLATTVDQLAATTIVPPPDVIFHRRRRRLLTRTMFGTTVTAILAAGAVAVLDASSGPSASAPPIARLSPAPRSCPLPLPRGGSVPATRVPELLAGSVPIWLPPGFGLARAEDTSSVTWTDQECREATLDYSHTTTNSSITQRWTVVVNKPGACGNEVLGTARCVELVNTGRGFTIRAAFMGVTPATAKEVVNSIPVSGEPVFLGGGTATFTPTPTAGSSAPLTAEQAYEVQSHGKPMPSTTFYLYGTLTRTTTDTPSRPSDYIFRDRPVWAFPLAERCNSEVRLSTPTNASRRATNCISWDFLDASTGDIALEANQTRP